MASEVTVPVNPVEAHFDKQKETVNDIITFIVVKMAERAMPSSISAIA